MKNPNTITEATQQYMTNNNIAYSPVAFSEAMEEVRKTYVHITTVVVKDDKLGFISDNGFTSKLHN